MKSYWKYILSAGLFACSFGSGNAAFIYNDPLIASAVYAQTDQLKKAYEERNKTQNKIIAAQAAVAVAMEEVHRIEKDILGYMQNASGAVRNLHQLKRIAELVAIDIPDKIKQLTTTIPDNMKNTAMVAALPSTYTDIGVEITSLSTLVTSLVKNTHYTWGENEEKDPNDERLQINLLSAAERYYIAQEVLNRLENIDRRLWWLNFKIKTMSWSRLFYELDYEGWCNYYYGKSIANGLIDEWNRLCAK